jgi:hypothetical protein
LLFNANSAIFQLYHDWMVKDEKKTHMTPKRDVV